MRPIRTTQSNFTYLGPAPDIADLPGRREGRHFYGVFQLTDEEREQVANGAQVEIGIYAEPIPPISVKLVNEEEAPGVEEHGVPLKPDYRCEGCDGLYVAERAVAMRLKCGWCGGDLRLPGAAA